VAHTPICGVMASPWARLLFDNRRGNARMQTRHDDAATSVCAASRSSSGAGWYEGRGSARVRARAAQTFDFHRGRVPSAAQRDTTRRCMQSTGGGMRPANAQRQAAAEGTGNMREGIATGKESEAVRAGTRMSRQSVCRAWRERSGVRSGYTAAAIAGQQRASEVGCASNKRATRSKANRAAPPRCRANA